MILERIEWTNTWRENARDDVPRVLLIGDSITQGYRSIVNRMLEGKIRVELLGEAVQAQTLLTADDGDVQLIASHPYDQMYWMYLLAMLFCASGEVARYENAAALFNAAYMGYAKLVKRGDA